jgi:hypothetical protein
MRQCGVHGVMNIPIFPGDHTEKKPQFAFSLGASTWGRGVGNIHVDYVCCMLRREDVVVCDLNYIRLE